MHGIGNDFIIIDDRDSKILGNIAYNNLAKKMCKRRFSVGADGLIIVRNSKICDIKFVIYNSDGSSAEMCGNGMRCFARYLYDNNIVKKKRFNVETLAGVIIPEIDSKDMKKVTIDMGEPSFDSENIVETLLTEKGDINITPISIGNPHAVIFVDKTDDKMVWETGSLIENHKRFPQKTNVEFIEVISDKEINMRVWERGVGETLACGTGACAALAASYLNKKTAPQALVHLRGGDLFIKWDKTNNHIYKTGNAEYVFKGVMALE